MITIGIPSYNGEKTIARAINSVLSQISKKDELIVVSSGSIDDTNLIVNKLSKKDKRIKLIIEPERRGKSSAINLIIKNARSEVVVQSDDDIIIQKGAIKQLIKHFRDPKIGAVSGNPIPIIPKDNLFYDWTIMSYRKIGEIRKEETKQGTFWHLSGYLLAFRKKALKEVPFAKGSVDAWMGKIVKDNGYKLIYEPNAKVLVKAPLTPKDFIAQKARVRAGYYNLPKAPRTLSGEILYLPKEFIKIPIWRWHQFIISGFIYLYSWIRGWYLNKAGKTLEQIWVVPESTKR